MVKIDSFDLYLDRFNGHYVAGDTVTGAVYVSVTARNSVKIRELNVTLIGDTKTSWVNKISDTIYDSTEPCLNSRQTFRQLLNDVVDGRGHLPPGTHRFPFKFLLPSTLPSSYEGEFGSIRYSCLAEINVVGGDAQRATSFRTGLASSRAKKFNMEKVIIVTAQVPISQLSPPNSTSNGLRKEGSYETSGCCGFGIGRVNAAVSIQQSIFVLGQSILVQVWLENNTRGRTHRRVILSLLQSVYFRSMSFFQTAFDSKTINKVIDSINLDLPERGKDLTNTVSIKVPGNVPPTSLNTDGLISIRYDLRLAVEQFEITLPIGLASKM